MALNLTNWLNTLKDTWENLTPIDDESGEPYNFVDTIHDESGNGEHREFVLMMVEENRYNAENCGMAIEEWDIPVMLFLHRNNRPIERFVLQTAEEIKEIKKAYSGVSTWGAGVREVILDDVTVEVPEEEDQPQAGGIHEQTVARVTFPFRVTTEET